MPRRLLLTIAALGLAVTLGSAGCADTVAPAVRVGDAAISHDEITSELEEWAGNPSTQASQTLPVPGIERGFALEPASAIIGERIVLEIFAAEFDARGLEITPTDRTNVFSLIGIDPSQEEELLGGFSDEFREEYLDRWAKVSAVQVDIGVEEDLREVIDARADDVELSSRYGTWDPRAFAVTPPPRPAPPATAEATGVDPSAP